MIEGAVFLALLVGIRAWQRRGVVEGQAPPLEGTSLSGERVTLAGADGPTLVHFWATWCGVCDAMDSNVAAVAGDHRVVTIAVQSGTNEAIVRAMAEDGLAHDGRPDFPVLSDPGGALAARWGVEAFPTSFVVGADGSIRSVEVGYTTELGLRARLALAD